LLFVFSVVAVLSSGDWPLLSRQVEDGAGRWGIGAIGREGRVDERRSDEEEEEKKKEKIFK